jgi:hypothetical protein
VSAFVLLLAPCPEASCCHQPSIGNVPIARSQWWCCMRVRAGFPLVAGASHVKLARAFMNQGQAFVLHDCIHLGGYCCLALRGGKTTCVTHHGKTISTHQQHSNLAATAQQQHSKSRQANSWITCNGCMFFLCCPFLLPGGL